MKKPLRQLILYSVSGVIAICALVTGLAVDRALSFRDFQRKNFFFREFTNDDPVSTLARVLAFLPGEAIYMHTVREWAYDANLSDTWINNFILSRDATTIPSEKKKLFLKSYPLDPTWIEDILVKEIRAGNHQLLKKVLGISTEEEMVLEVFDQLRRKLRKENWSSEDGYTVSTILSSPYAPLKQILQNPIMTDGYNCWLIFQNLKINRHTGPDLFDTMIEEAEKYRQQPKEAGYECLTSLAGYFLDPALGRDSQARDILFKYFGNLTISAYLKNTPPRLEESFDYGDVIAAGVSRIVPDLSVVFMSKIVEINELAALLLFHELVHQSPETANVVLAATEHWSDSIFKKGAIVLGNRHDLDVSPKLLTEAFRGAAPRVISFEGFGYLWQANEATQTFESLTGYPYTKGARSHNLTIVRQDVPLDTQIKQWKGFIDEFPWHPGTDDAYYHLAMRQLAKGNNRAALNTSILYWNSPVADHSADRLMVDLLADVIRKRRLPPQALSTGETLKSYFKNRAYR